MKVFKQVFLFSFVLFLFSTSINFVSAQKQIVPDSRIAEVYGQAKVDAMMQSAPQKILHFNYFLNNSFYVSKTLPANTIPKGDIYSVSSRNDDFLFNESEELVKQGKFNRLKYSFRMDSYNYTAYEMGSSGVYVIFYPEETFFAKERAYTKGFGLK